MTLKFIRIENIIEGILKMEPKIKYISAFVSQTGEVVYYIKYNNPDRNKTIMTRAQLGQLHRKMQDIEAADEALESSAMLPEKYK